MEIQISQPDFDINNFSIYQYELYYHPLNIEHSNYYNKAIGDNLFFELARRTPWSNIALERVEDLFTGYEPLRKCQSRRTHLPFKLLMTS